MTCLTMTTNISIADHVSGYACPVCLDAWTPDMVPVKVKFHWRIEVVCGQCARQMGVTARKEQRRRRLESEAVRGKVKRG